MKPSSCSSSSSFSLRVTKLLKTFLQGSGWNLMLSKVNGFYGLVAIIVLPKLQQGSSWFVTHLYCLMKSVMQIIFLENCYNSWSVGLMSDAVYGGRWTTLTMGWKLSMNGFRPGALTGSKRMLNGMPSSKKCFSTSEIKWWKTSLGKWPVWPRIWGYSST